MHPSKTSFNEGKGNYKSFKWRPNFSDYGTKMFSFLIVINYTFIFPVKCTLLVSLKEEKAESSHRMGKDSQIQWFFENSLYQWNPSISGYIPPVAESVTISWECLAYLSVIPSDTKKEEMWERKRTANKECTIKPNITRQLEAYPARELKEPV